MELNPYAKFLDGEDPVPVLFTTTSRLQALIAPLSLEAIEQTPGPGKWSIREILCHLADCELVFCFRLRQAMAEDHPVIQPFDQDAWARTYAAYDLPSALAMFTAARNWNLRLISSLTEADRHRPITHPERGTMTLWTIVETMAGHDINHLGQIEYLAC